MADTDPYGTAKTNLRDNVKILFSVFGGVAGVLLAGTPFSGFGALDWPSLPALLASIGIVLAVGFLGLGLKLLLEVIHPHLGYEGALRDPKAAMKRAEGRLDRAEIAALIHEVSAHGAEIFTTKEKTYDALDRATSEAWKEYERTGDDLDRKAYDDFASDRQFALDWAAFVRFRARVVAGTDRAMLFGLVALFGIGLFAAAIGAAKKSVDEPRVIVVDARTTVAPPVGPHSPGLFSIVQFATGDSTLTTDATNEVARIQAHLRTHPADGVLVYAYTDTQGGDARNAELAYARARTVATALRREGGVAASRIFTSVLPVSDLPVLTARQIARSENRSVEMRVVPLPDRVVTKP